MFNIKIISAIVAGLITLFIALGASVYYYKSKYLGLKIELEEKKDDIKTIKTSLNHVNNLVNQKINYINLLNQKFEIDQNKTKHDYQIKIDKLLNQIDDSNKSKDIFTIKENNNTCECKDVSATTESKLGPCFELNNKTPEWNQNLDLDPTQGLDLKPVSDPSIKTIKRD